MFKKKSFIICTLLVTILFLMGCNNPRILIDDNTIQTEPAIVTTNPVAASEEEVYYFPHEGDEHEGTWLQWPHDKTYEGSIEAYDPIWIEMTRGLVKGENVHLIVYDEVEKKRVTKILQEENIDMSKVDFFVFPTDDVWVRDNGPIFVYDSDGNVLIENWEFNGWGNKAPYKKDNLVPTKISEALDMPKIDIDMIMEGGALELDGNGTCISTLSCVNNDNRTAEFSLDEIEAYLSKYYGVTNFIWLEGVAGMDITDNHIDGMIKFTDEKTIVADSEFDLDIDDLPEDDDAYRLLTATNINGEPYDFIFLPQTKDVVIDVEGEWIKGAYLNFYVGNKVVLVPNYEDENDAVANQILQDLYPDREVIGIDVRNLYADGGMIHCVTQQQPLSKIKE